MAAATDFCNDQCWGTLSCAVFVHPATQVGARTCMPAAVCMHQKVKGRSVLAHSLLVLQPMAAPTLSCTPRSSAQAPRRIRRPGGGAALRQRVHQRAHPHWLCHHQADLGSLPAGRHAAGKGLLLGGRGGWVSGSMGCTRPLCVRVQPGCVSPPGSRCALSGLWQCHAAPPCPPPPPRRTLAPATARCTTRCCSTTSRSRCCARPGASTQRPSGGWVLCKAHGGQPPA